MTFCKNIFRRLTAALTLLFTAYVLYCSATDMYFCYLSGSTRHLTYILLAAAFVLACTLLLFAGRCSVLADKPAGRLTAVLFCLMVLLQLGLTAVAFRHYLPWADSLSVINEAVSMSASASPAVSSAGRYFEMYGNNYFFTIVLCYFFRFFRLFGLTSYWMEGLLLNIFAMDLGVFFCILTVRRLLGPQKGLLMTSLCLVNPLLYVFIPFVYTNTISIPFTMGIFCMALLLSREKRPKRLLLYAFCEAVLVVIGFQIRVTTLIPVIALLLYRLVKGSSRPGHLPLREAWKPAAVFLLSAALLFGGCRALIDSHVPADIQAGNFPVTHWIMMGLQGDGTYLSLDEDFTYNIPDKADKQAANLEEIQFRLGALADLGPSGILDFLSRKLTATWAAQNDGLYLETGRMQAYNPLQKYLFGFKNDLLLYYYQFFKVMLYAFCILGLLRELLAKKTSPFYPYILTLFGFFLFYLLWEANCRYTICLTLLLCMLAFYGMEWVLGAGCRSAAGAKTDGLFKEAAPAGAGSFLPAALSATGSRRRLYKRAAGLFLALGVLLPCLYAMYRQYPAYTQTFIPKVDYSVITVGRSYHENAVTDLIRDDKVLTQTFTTAHPFNEVGVYCGYNGEEEWAEEMKEEQDYLFRLLDAEGSVLAQEVFGPESGGKYYKLFGFDPVIPAGETTYTIELSPASPDSADRLGFLYFDFDTYDYIFHADLSVNGQSLDRDLIFMVDYGYTGPYTTPARYGAACAAIVLFLLCLLALLLTDRRPRGKFFSSLFAPKLLQ